jgi:hypothetical protein
LHEKTAELFIGETLPTIYARLGKATEFCYNNNRYSLNKDEQTVLAKITQIALYEKGRQ